MLRYQHSYGEENLATFLFVGYSTALIELFLWGFVFPELYIKVSVTKYVKQTCLRL